MQHDAFIGQVQARARLDSRGAAERATRASLETLAERVPPTVADKAASQLPHEIGEHLRRVAHAPDEPANGHHMNQHAFFTRVAKRAGTTYPKAVHEARCVIEVAEEATAGALGRKIRPSLDHELGKTLFAGSSGRA
ncbi:MULTISPECIES: DUF2267 domain-containing protein [unclassified Streptomyces]|uniref:DUF2267 domain-containing protein n=1 Tax=unclassified Streptomyces TaxID=2593676 RepID=UPI00331AE5B9